jgi:hypothetical protein
MEDGRVTNAVGRERKCQIGGRSPDRRYVFTVSLADGKKYPVMVHKLQAFQKFGEAMFEPGILVRHLDEDSLNNRPDNIALGTSTDNAMDRQPLVRKLHAQKAGRTASRHSEEFWQKVTAEYEAGDGYKVLGKRYGLSPGTLSYRLSKTGKRTVMKQ